MLSHRGDQAASNVREEQSPRTFSDLVVFRQKHIHLLRIGIFELPCKVAKNRDPQSLGSWTITRPWPIRNWASQQEVSSGRASRASSVFTAAPYCSH